MVNSGIASCETTLRISVVIIPIYKGYSNKSSSRTLRICVIKTQCIQYNLFTEEGGFQFVVHMKALLKNYTDADT